MESVTVRCNHCKGSGDCPDHNEHFIDVDITIGCLNCQDGKCPVCEGTGEVTEDYQEYHFSENDPRD